MSVAVGAALVLASCSYGTLSAPAPADVPTTTSSPSLDIVERSPSLLASRPVTVSAAPVMSPATPPDSTPPEPATPTSPAPGGSPLVSASPSASARPAADQLVADPDPTAVPFPPCPGIHCLSIVISGDVLLHPQLIEQARADAGAVPDTTVDGLNFLPLLAGQRRYVAGADIGICHLETPLAPPQGPFSNYPTFSVPPQVLPALVATGYDACTTASNHPLAQGTTGLDRTLNELDAAGLFHDGSYRTPEEASTPLVVNTRAGRVGLISAAYGFNGYEPDQDWQVNTIDIPDLKARAAHAKQAGADLVIVALHAGDEYDHQPNAQQKDAAKALLADPDIDLVYGHHAHVVQPLERINGKWAIYGLGNNLAAQLDSAPGVQQGLLVRMQFSLDAGGSWTTSDVAWVPSYQQPSAPYRWCALTPTDTCGTGDDTALDETTAIVDQWGASTDGGAHRLN